MFTNEWVPYPVVILVPAKQFPHLPEEGYMIHKNISMFRKLYSGKDVLINENWLLYNA